MGEGSGRRPHRPLHAECSGSAGGRRRGPGERRALRAGGGWPLVQLGRSGDRSVIGGISAGVGGWLPGSGSQPPTSRRVERRAWSATWSTPRSAPSTAAVGAFAQGGLTSGLFMGLNTLTSRFWTWRLGTHAPAGDWARSRSMVAATLAEPDPVPGSSAAAPGSEIPARVLRNILDSRRAREASRFREYVRAEAEWEDIARWRATHGYQYDVFREGPLGGLRPVTLHATSTACATTKWCCLRSGCSTGPAGKTAWAPVHL